MNKDLDLLNSQIIACSKCDRLVKFREQIATIKRKQYICEEYWGKPVHGYGDYNDHCEYIGLTSENLIHHVKRLCN